MRSTFAGPSLQPGVQDVQKTGSTDIARAFKLYAPGSTPELHRRIGGRLFANKGDTGAHRIPARTGRPGTMEHAIEIGRVHSCTAVITPLIHAISKICTNICSRIACVS